MAECAALSRLHGRGYSSVRDHRPPDQYLLDLRRPLVEAEQPCVAVEMLDRVIRHVAGAAEDLYRAVGDAADHLAGEVLEARRLHADIGAAIALPRRVEHHAACRIGLGAAVGEHRLDELELADPLAELLALARVGHRLGDQPFGEARADGGDMEATPIEHLHPRLEADSLLAADQRP